MKGINRALATSMVLENRNFSHGKKCVFLSHKSEDKDDCIKIEEYLNNAGIDTYLDINDAELQIAWMNQDIETMTNCIKKGIKESTHILCIISEKTIDSKWVPFEIGYAHSSIIDANPDKKSKKYRVSILKLEDISEDTLPEYLQIVPNIEGGKSFDDYINNVLNSSEYQFINESKNLRLYSKHNHPLYGILNLNK